MQWFRGGLSAEGSLWVVLTLLANAPSSAGVARTPLRIGSAIAAPSPPPAEEAEDALRSRVLAPGEWSNPLVPEVVKSLRNPSGAEGWLRGIPEGFAGGTGDA